MKIKLLALTFSIFSVGLLAQDTPAEPEFVNQYFVLNDGKLQRLENATLKMQSKTSNRFVMVKGTTSEVVDGTQSPVRVAPDAHFIVRMQTGDIDPTTMIHLKQFKVGKNDRELLMHSGGAVIFAGTKSKGADDTSIPISVKKYGSKSLEVTPSQPLAPGEYFFSAMGMEADCFSVGAK
ncbi:MAG: hypothetical protein M3Y72_04620 [Acidobacteriota bacterium]|nr:hypothetical protein [Acidobacteriota bacterium]